MRVHFLVLAHEHAPAVWRLADRLAAEPGASVSVHWDSSTSAPLAPPGLDVVVHSSPAPSGWGTGAQLDAAIAALRSVAGQPFDWLVLLSGSCYPIRPPAQLAAFLDTTPHLAFLETHAHGPVPPPTDTSEPLTYLQRRYFVRYRWVPTWLWRRLPAPAAHGAEVALQRSVRACTPEREVWVQRRPRAGAPGIGRRIRRHPFSATRPCRTGSDWFALARPVYDDLLAQLAAEPALVEHFRRTFCPNEALFHTLVLPRWEHANAGHNLHHRHMGPTEPHPTVLRDADWDAMVASGRFLARKFDPADRRLLDRIDHELLGR